MKILWYADFEGTRDQLDRVNAIMDDMVKENGGAYEGPFLPQQSDVMWILSVPEFEWLNRTGRHFLARIKEENIPLTPMKYEVAVTPEEFWG